MNICNPRALRMLCLTSPFFQEREVKTVVEERTRTKPRSASWSSRKTGKVRTVRLGMPGVNVVCDMFSFGSLPGFILVLGDMVFRAASRSVLELLTVALPA